MEVSPSVLTVDRTSYSDCLLDGVHVHLGCLPCWTHLFSISLTSVGLNRKGSGDLVGAKVGERGKIQPILV
jgi:hypothetical protein